MNFNINSLLVVLILFSCVSSQAPNWIISELEESEELVEDISELISSKLNRSISFKTLSETLYFIPDSLIQFYLESDERLSIEDDDYIDQFFLSEKMFRYRSVFRRELNTNLFNGLGDKSRLKSNYSFSDRSYNIQLNQQKSAYETYFKHHYLFGAYRFNSFGFYAGNLKISGFNPLVFGTPYGSFYYGFNSIIKNSSIKISGQSSLNKQNTMKGFASSYSSEKLEFYAVYGLQDYAVRIDNSVFSSFNFYHPIETESDNSYDSITEKIGLLHLNYKIDINLSISTSISSFNFSDTYVKKNDFSAIEINRSTFYGIKIRYSKNNFNSQINLTHQKHMGKAYEFSSSFKTSLTKLETVLYKYGELFINPHSLGILNGSSFANNLYGQVFNGHFKLSKKNKFYFGIHTRKKIQSSKLEQDDITLTKFIYFGVQQKWNSSSLLFRYAKQSEKSVQAIFTSELFRSKFYYYPEKNGISFSTEKRFGKLFTKCSFVSTDESLRVYRNGFQWEFLSESFKGENLNLNLKYSFEYSESISISFDYHGTYRFDKSEFGSGTKLIKSQFKNEIGVFLALIY